MRKAVPAKRKAVSIMINAVPRNEIGSASIE